MTPDDADTVPTETTTIPDDSAEAAPKRKRPPRKKALLTRAPEAKEVFNTPQARAVKAAGIAADRAAAEAAAQTPDTVEFAAAGTPAAAGAGPAADGESSAGAAAAPAAAAVPASIDDATADTTAAPARAGAEAGGAIDDRPGAAAEPVPAAAPAAVAADATTEPAATDATPAADGATRRSRNRRRGRRGGERVERAETSDLVRAAETQAGADAAPAEDDVDDVEEGTAAATPLQAPPLAPADVGELFAEVLSGAYDATAPDNEAAPVQPPKRVLGAEPDAPKLHKVLAQAGVGSRRDMEQMIVEGRITVNGEPAHIGQRISFGDRIAVGGKPVRFRIAPPVPRVLAYHKPAGEVVTHDDPQQRPTVFRRLPRLQQGKWQSVGRLDINTEGLLLFTNSGELANQLMHPRFGVEREYAVRSLGVIDDTARERLLEGVDIDGQRCAFKTIDDGGGEGANHWYRCVITEGRNREVRKLFESVGHAVSRLIRIRYGSVVLPKGLKRGIWVDLGDDDVRTLRRIAGGDRQPQPREDRGPRPDNADAGNRRNNNNNKQRSRNADAPQQPRPPRPEFEGGAIPNPLQQTYDRRAIQQERQQRREIPEDGPIPNPLQQTYDRRALQTDRAQQREPSEDGPIPNPLQQTYDKRFAQKAHGPGGPNPNNANRGNGRRGGGGGSAGGGERQPDPMQTSVGYIGGDAFLRRGAGGRGGPRGGGAGGQGSRGGGGNRGGRR